MSTHPNVRPGKNGAYVVTNPVGESMKTFRGKNAETRALAYALECDPMWARLAALQAEREAMVADGRAVVVSTS